MAGECSYLLFEIENINLKITVITNSNGRLEFIKLMYQSKIYNIGPKNKITADGRDITHLDGKYRDGNIILYRSSSSVITEINDQIRLEYNPIGSFMVCLPVYYKRAVETKGICGSYDDNSFNDLVTKNGRILKNDLNGKIEFGRSWKIPGKSCTEELLIRECSKEDRVLYKSRKYCGTLIDDIGPFSQCDKTIRQKFYEICIMDLCNRPANSSFHSIMCPKFGTLMDKCSEKNTVGSLRGHICGNNRTHK